MAVDGEWEFPDVTMTLTLEEATAFRDNVVWPAIDHLSPQPDFINSAPPESSIHFCFATITQRGLSRVALEATIELAKYDHNGQELNPPIRYAEAFITVEHRDQDGELAKKLIVTATGSEEFDQESAEGLKAWTITQYEVTGNPEEHPFQRYVYHELRDPDEEEMWTDQDMTAPLNEEGGLVSQDQEDILESLDRDLSTTTNTDRGEVLIALSGLGIPAYILCSDV